jgi:murein DD-endopeptidase MepM/ murein hydrolase activator NlpD
LGAKKKDKIFPRANIYSLIMRKNSFGILLVLMLSSCANHAPIAEQAAPRYYTVQAGDNLEAIAFVLETTPESLLLANPWLEQQSVAPGMRLIVSQAPADDDDQTSISQDSGGYSWPVARVDVSSPFGYRLGRLHSGIDLRAPRGTPIKASAQGKVVFSGAKNGFGRFVIIDHGHGIKTAYAHNHRNLVRAGQWVKKGEVIATVGRSGNASGYHVHFEFRRRGKAVDPVQHLPAI